MGRPHQFLQDAKRFGVHNESERQSSANCLNVLVSGTADSLIVKSSVTDH